MLNRFWNWLWNIPDPTTKRNIDIIVDIGSPVKVAKVTIQRSELAYYLKNFDTLEIVVFPVAEED